jgi:hypothetical protein
MTRVDSCAGEESKWVPRSPRMKRPMTKLECEQQMQQLQDTAEAAASLVAAVGKKIGEVLETQGKEAARRELDIIEKHIIDLARRFERILRSLL